MTLTVGSIYSGAIDAFGYACNMLNNDGCDFELKYQIEIERAAHKYLRKNYQDAKRFYTDEYTEQYNLEYADILCGGDSCQPHSSAGNREGENDNRFRWPYMLALIKAKRPHWVINENVIGSVSNLVLDKKITDLERAGYTTQAFNIPACAVGACHERKRIFLIAHADVLRRKELLYSEYGNVFTQGSEDFKHALDTQGNAFLQFEQSGGEPALLSVDDGIPDHIFRLGAAGQSIVSPIPIILLKAIWEIEKFLQ